MRIFICIIALVATVMSQTNDDILRTSNEQFTAKMFQEVYKDNKGKNVVLSAFSVMPPLAQLALAAKGASHDEILNAIGLPNDNVTKSVFSDMTKQLKSVKGVDLSLATRIYVRKGVDLNDKFALMSKEVFNSDVKNIDFSQSAAAANEINQWVEENTNHRIKDLLSTDDIDATTAAVLANAIYFKGKWKNAFEAENTADRDFYVSKDNVIKVPTMKQTASFNYGDSKELDAKLLEMSYEGDQASLLIVLPNEVDGIDGLVEKLKDPSLLKKATKDMYYQEVDVQMPKFKIETTTKLDSVLKRMNINKIFTPEAHLENLLNLEANVYISSAIQKAFIDVNEEGAEAAAANALDGVLDSSVEYWPPPPLIKIDRPFYYELRQNNLPFYEGILSRPELG